ncbi:MAG: efflux RND transporter permease subunit, partial [Desulfobacteraceae bacterium]|nr:efflux RND transporter permease subunit [Desulfobacteraceae bacterium]
IELGAETYDMTSSYNGKQSASIAVFQLPGANALQVSARVEEKMKELSKSFPQGLEYHVPFNTTRFISSSISEVLETLLIASALVLLVIFLFLQDWRASLIPAVTIPVCLIGTFAVMGFLGISLNMISLFAIVLAIGIVVDDAIVVVENASRHIEEAGSSPKAATIKAMGEVTGPIIATTLVLMAVFVPTAFLGGISGPLYRQFALTIATATVFSALNALTMSPALCAIVLRPGTGKRRNFVLRAFNWTYEKGRAGYVAILQVMVRRAVFMVPLFGILAGTAYFGFVSLPTGFLPPEDQGYAMMSIQLPDSASLQRTNALMDRISQKLNKIPGVESYFIVSGYSLLDGSAASNAAASWVMFHPWGEREKRGLGYEQMLGQIMEVATSIEDASVSVFPPPSILGLGEVGGFQLQVQDKGDMGLSMLAQVVQEMVQDSNGQAGLRNVFSMFRANVPQLLADVDRTQAKSLDVPLSNIFDSLQAYLGSLYINDFNKFGRTYQVKIQADAPYRKKIDDIRQIEVRNNKGEMVPLASLVNVKKTLGPQVINRYNTYPSASINGEPAPGYSSGESLAIMERMANSRLPISMGVEWTGIAYQEKVTAGQATGIFVLAVIFVYLVLCAQYESWSIPMSVILVVPLGLLGTVAALAVRAMDVNLYTEIGIVLLIGMICKTAILIVEFAKVQREGGIGITEAALEASLLRFRPIVMTAATFILGVLPLVVASGAGAGSRQALGTAVFGGMLAATMLMVLFVPVFFVIIQGLSERLRRPGKRSIPAKPEMIDS